MLPEDASTLVFNFSSQMIIEKIFFIQFKNVAQP